jgi:hypothetical protein
MPSARQQENMSASAAITHAGSQLTLCPLQTLAHRPLHRQQCGGLMGMWGALEAPASIVGADLGRWCFAQACGNLFAN